MKTNKLSKTALTLSLLIGNLSLADEQDRQPASVSYPLPTIQQEIEKKEQAPGESPEYLTGKWGGLRTHLSETGLELQFTYKGDVARNFTGGNKVGNAFISNLDLRLSVDAEKEWGWGGTSFMIYGLGNNVQGSSKPSELVGDTQLTNNIEAIVDDFKLYEFYIQKVFFENRVSILFGLHDLNTEFYVTDASAVLMNSSFGTGKDLSQSGLQGPSIFPYTAPALRFRAEPTKSSYFQAAAFNARAGDPSQQRGLRVDSKSADGYLLIAEAGLTPSSKDLNAKYSLGVWSYTDKFPNLDGASMANSSGAYVLLNQDIREDLSVFFRYGRASAASNKVGSSLTAGLLMKAPWARRPKDKVSLGVATVFAGSDFKDLQKKAGIVISDDETSIELTYKVHVIEGLFIQPDLQYVTNPSFSKTLDPALLGTVRIEANF